MKNYRDFMKYVAKNGIEGKTPMVAVYRESALSPIQEMDLIMSGNTIYATNRSKFKGGKIQEHLSRVGELTNAVEQFYKDYEDRNHTYYVAIIKHEMSEINLVVKMGNRSKTGYGVKDFHYQDGKLLMDIA